MNIRQVRKKIKTISNIKKITRAMELVSAVKMKKSQQEAIQGRPYQEMLEDVIKKVTQLVDPAISSLLKGNDATHDLAILISTNKGLCGSFNFNLFRFCLDEIEIKNTDFIVIGKLGSYFVNKFGGKIIADFSTSKAEDSVSAVFELAISKFLVGEYRKISLIFNQFISAAKHEPMNKILLPIQLEKDITVAQPKELAENYMIEPQPELIIDSLLRNYIEQKIRGAIISSEAGEHSARMIAMKNATDNATQFIYDLTLARNKLRQEKITYELLDMITAKESVEIN